jgi:dGTPase
VKKLGRQRGAMEWPSLLSPVRLGQEGAGPPDPLRSPYIVDADRIVFSSAFRRLQDKTQVFPLADNDYVRTRLTHSLEVASVARSLGTRVGAALVQRHRLEKKFHASDFGAVVSAAALAHDLGNPPFGHSGEDAIRHWFKTSPVAAAVRAELSPEECADFEDFEGNAQGFRIITRLQMPDNPGLRLTCATLGAFTKYPRAARLPARATGGVSMKKFGFFKAERGLFAEVAAHTGLLPRGRAQWCRHPLAFLVEAADDICYRLVDFEDGYRLRFLSYEEVRAAFLKVTGDARDAARADKIADPKDRIAFLRAQAIGAAIQQVADAFLAHEPAMLEGAFDQELLDLELPASAALREIKQRSRETIYATPRGVEIEAAGYEVLGGLLEVFCSAADDIARRGGRASRRSHKLLQLIPAQFLGAARPYERLLQMTDFVSGMTDSYAVALYKKVRGISLPGA